MAVLGAILEHGLQRVLPLLHSSFFTGNSDDSLTDAATLRILAENIRYYDAVQRVSLKQAAESIESFLQLISYSSALVSKLSLDVDRWIEILKEVPPSMTREKIAAPIAKSKVRKRKEQRLNRFHLVEEESEQRENQMQTSLPPFYPTELKTYNLVDDSFTDDENFIEINMATVWERKIVNFYMKAYNTTKIERFSKADILVFALTILTGAQEILGFAAFNPKSWKFPKLCAEDNENLDSEQLGNLTKVSCIFAHMIARITRIQNGSWIQKMIIENVIEKIEQLTEISGLLIQAAFYDEEFELADSSLTNPLDYLRLLDALLLCFDQEIPISLDLIKNLVVNWYKLEEELEIGEKGAAQIFGENVLLSISKTQKLAISVSDLNC
ncbi:unnamed protein product, partial [Mesorhabditis belari]|uniref:Uncharacterized protein n=1 Tax=Mesorhabditis belari TaxID=2138241 RepID=A0AAF3FQS8_9BILA